MRFLKFIFTAAIALLLSFPGVARAACLNPEGVAGELMFNADHATMQYCNGADWISFPKAYAASCTPAYEMIGASRSNMGASMSGDEKWAGGVLGPDGKIYGIPYYSGDILIIDPAAGTATRSTMGASLSGLDKWIGGVLGLDGKIYGIPYNSTTILIIDPVAGTATRSNMGASLSGSGKWVGGVLGPDGKIYGIPWDSTDILIIDPAAGTATRSAMGASLSGIDKWSGGVLGPDGKIYGIPADSTNILIIDPAAGTATRSTMGASLSGDWKWFGGALGPDGKIYGIPQESGNILIIDPIAGTATRSTMGAALSGNFKWDGGVLGLDGKIYGIPHQSSTILIIDPVAGTATRSNMGASLSGGGWIGGVVDPNGSIYGIPDSSNILIIESAASGCEGDGCENPEGAAGRIIYSGNHRVLQWCDGASWQAAGPLNPGGPNDGCENPAEPGGSLLFNQASCSLQYCDGHTWRGIGKSDPCACNGASTVNLIAHWTFDEGSGGSAGDSSGNGNDGTINGASWAAGHIGPGALSFDGDDDEVIIAGLLGSPAVITLVAWVDLESTDGKVRAEVISLGDHVAMGLDYSFYFDGSDWNSTDDYEGVAGTGWRHIAFVIDPANSSQKIYLDGVEVGSTAYGGAISYGALGAGTRIGNHGNNASDGDYHFYGRIDDVRVYSGALSATQVHELYSTGDVALACP